MYTWTLQKWDVVELEREYEFWKRGKEIVTVVGIFPQWNTRFALMDNGMKFYILPPLSSNHN